MIPIIEKRIDDLEQLCVRYNVLRLDLFGSAVTCELHPEGSDLDFVVDFQPEAFGAYADTYFGLLEALELLFGQPETSSLIPPLRIPSSANESKRPGPDFMRLEIWEYF